MATNSVNIKADTNEKIKGRGYGEANVGVGAAGASKVNIYSKGTTNTLVSQDSGVSSGIGGTTISSLYSTDIDSKTKAATGGAIDATGSFSKAIIEPTITTEIGNRARLRSNGDVKINTELYDKLLSEADGYGLGGISVGLSYAKANNEAHLNSIIGDNVSIAAQNFYMMTYENMNPSYDTLNTADKVIKENTLTALAKSSVGTLIGDSGAYSTTSNQSFLASNVGKNSKINTREGITIKTISHSEISSKSEGAAYGVAAYGSTQAWTHNSGETSFELNEDSKLIAPNLVFVNSSAIRDAYATAFGGVGGLINGSGTSADVDMGNLVSTRIDDNTKIIANNHGNIFLYSQGVLHTNATSSTHSVGAITENQVKSHIDIKKQDISTYIGKSDIVGSWIFIRALNSALYANSNAYSKTKAAGAYSKSYAFLKLLSNAGIVIDGSSIIGYDKVFINAEQRKDDMHAVTKAKSTLDSGIDGILYSIVENNPTFNSSVVFKNDAKIQTDNKYITAVGPYPYIKWGEHYTKLPIVENHSVVHWVEKKVWTFVSSLWKLVTEKVPEYDPDAGTEISKGNYITNSNVITSNVKSLESIDRDSPTITNRILPTEAANSPSTVKFLSSPSNSKRDDYGRAVKIQQDNDFEAFNPSSISGKLNGVRNAKTIKPILGGGDEITGLLEGAVSTSSEESKVSSNKRVKGNFSNMYVPPTHRKTIRMHKNQKFVIIDNRILGGRLLGRYTRITMFKPERHIMLPIFKARKHTKKGTLIRRRWYY